MHALTPPPAHDVLVGFRTTAGADAASAPRRANATHDDARGANAGMHKLLTRQSSDSSQSSFASVDVSVDRPDDAVSMDQGSLGSGLGASAERRQRGLTAALMEGNARDGRVSSQHSSDSDQDAFGTGDHARASGGENEKRAERAAFEPPVMVRANRASVMTARDVNDARWAIEREERDFDQRVDELFHGDALLEARSCPIDIPCAKRAHWKTYVVVVERVLPRSVRECARCACVYRREWSVFDPCGVITYFTWTRDTRCVWRSVGRSVGRMGKQYMLTDAVFVLSPPPGRRRTASTLDVELNI